jgi:hypothetical protein
MLPRLGLVFVPHDLDGKARGLADVAVLTLKRSFS